MKLDIPAAISERNLIIGAYEPTGQITALTEQDEKAHRYWLGQVYAQTLLYEMDVFDLCLRRFRKEFYYN